MADNPYIKLYGRDYLTSTRGMTCAARGAYVDLLILSWFDDGLPVDPDVLRRMVGADTREWRGIWPQVEGKWPVSGDGRRRNPREESERAKALDISNKRSESGKAGASARGKANARPVKSNSQANAEANGEANAKLSVSVAVAKPDPASSSDDDSASASGAEAWTSGQLRHASIDLLDQWARLGTGSPVEDFGKLSWKEKRDIVDALKRRSLAEWEVVFRRAAASDYLTGRDGQHPPMTLWKVLDEASKIMAGAYDAFTPAPVPAVTTPAPSKWAIDLGAEVERQRAKAAARGRAS